MFQTLEECSNNEPLYSKTQTVFVKRLCSEEKPRELNVYIVSSSSKVSKQSLYIQVTDEEDPYLLYSLLLTEEEYACLKSVQGLLVDFYNFPHELVRLFEECRKDGKESKFLLMLEEEAKNDGLTDGKRTYLKVVEANNFKHLCHLQLQLTAGSDDDIKKLMLGKIKLLKEINGKREGSISQLNAQVLHLTSELNKKNEDLNALQQKWNDEKITFQIEATKEISEETDKLRRSQTEWQLKMQRERKEMEDKFLASVRDKEDEISKLRVDNQILMDKRNSCETVIKDQQKQIELLDKEINNLKWDLSSLKKQSSKLDSDYHEKEKAVHTLKTKLAVSEQELKDKVIMLGKFQELLNSCNEQKTRLEELLTDKEKILRKKQVSLQNLSEELMKANEIIAKFQKELAIANSKLKVRTCVALEQEKVVETSKSKIKELENILFEKDKLLKSLGESEAHLKKRTEQLEEDNFSKDKMLKDNEKLIEWLNRRIDNARDNAVPHWSPSTGPLSSTPYSIVNATDDNVIHEDTPVTSDNLNKASKGSGKSPKVVNETPVSSVTADSKKKASGSQDSKKTSAKPVGFKRVSFPYQVSTIPSSYFSK